MSNQVNETKYNFNDEHNQIQKPETPKMNTIFWILSVISWLLLIVTGWISIKWLHDEDYYVIWTIFVERNFEKYYYLPFQMHVALAYIAFIFSLVIILFGFVLYFIRTFISKNENIIKGMLGLISKFHFIPLLFASSLFIIGECYNNKIDFSKHEKEMHIAGLIFSILGLISSIFIYIKTDLNGCKWWEILLLKKGAYSCLIILMWYYFCYVIYHVHSSNNEDETFEEKWNWKRGCGIFFSVFFGLGTLVFSFIFKDVIASFMNMIIYTGLVVYYYKIPNYFRKLKYLNKNADGGVDIAILFLSLVNCCILLTIFRKDCFKS